MSSDQSSQGFQVGQRHVKLTSVDNKLMQQKQCKAYYVNYVLDAVLMIICIKKKGHVRGN